MRPFELLLSLVNTITLVGLAFLRRKRAAGYSAAAAVPVAAAQAIGEGLRWQMFPAYALTGILLLAWRLRAPDARTKRGHLGRLIALLGAAAGLGLSVLLPLLFPVFRFPKPTGPYAIGTLTYHWIDTQRLDPFLADSKTPRELMVQIWYPALDNPSAPRTPYVEQPEVLSPLARLLHLPGFLFGHLKYITTNAVQAAPIVGGEIGFPVLICSHGRGGYRQESTWLTEALVAQGYIVVCIDHPYAASGVALPDGRILSFDPRMIDRPFVNASIPWLADDVHFVLDQLESLNRADPQGILTGRLDMQRIGMFGLSLGGETTAQSCLHDSRLRACAIMDVWMPAEVLQTGLAQPTLFLTRDSATMLSEGWSRPDVDETLDTMRAVYDRLPKDGYFVQVPGMYHQDFSDAPMLSPLTRLLGLTGPIEGQRGRDITGAYMLTFFDCYLKNQPAERISALVKHYPEVIFESRPLVP